MEALKRLFSHYRTYHQDGPLMLRFMGLFGALSFPLFYLLRFTKSTAPYDDLPLRLLNLALCLVLLLKDRWPRRLQPYYLGYSYAALIVLLPMTFMYTSLRNGGGLVGVGNTLMAVFFVILLTDWRNMLVMLAVGFSSAVVLYVATAPVPTVPVEYVARLPILLLVIVGGSAFKYASERATAERVRRAYASLAGSIAHEMRNPLAQLKHSLQNMQGALPRPTLFAQPQMLDASQVNALYGNLAQGEVAVNRGLQVIAMTLDEVHARPMDPAGFALLSAQQACQKAVQEYGYDNEGERARVSVRVVRDFVFRGDETAFLFVVFNLIKNSLYYGATHPDLRVVITVNPGQIQVRDSGPGIAERARAQLFEPFGSSGKVGGTGLGLAYCARVLRAFGGAIRCESVPGQFTEFIMTLPCATQQEQAAHRQAVLTLAREVFAGKRLLVVDDDAALRAVTRHKLVPTQATLDEATDGAQALALLSKTAYDLVLLDLNLPVMDGYAVAEAVRGGQAPASNGTRIVAYSSEPEHLARVKTHKAGCDAMVSKPCEQVPLLQILCQAMQGMPRHVPTSERVLAGRQVLIADDNSFNRKIVAALLRHDGAEVTEAASGQAALDRLRDMPRCDAVLLDIDMPGMDGLETARCMRADPAVATGLPILALTAHGGPDMRESALLAGMTDLLTKPVDAQALQTRLCELMPPLAPPAGAAEAAPEATTEVTTEAAPEAATGLAPGPGLQVMEPVAVYAVAVDITVAPCELLDLDRLENHARLGLLRELVDDYVPELVRLMVRLEAAAAQGDTASLMRAMHSMVGISGEAGARRLHQSLRLTYSRMVDSQPARLTPQGLRTLRALADDATTALRAFAAARQDPA